MFGIRSYNGVEALVKQNQAFQLSNHPNIAGSFQIWPHSSFDLNPLAYYVWSVVEKEPNKHLHNTEDSLRTAIRDVNTNIIKDQLINACSRFRSRIEAAIILKAVLLDKKKLLRVAIR